ncbi:MAG: DNA-binding MarR family transcriptional regulator [Candidatus Saccharimonadales bacterium]|jgi:DNA-binding MarR family transcriptional regulator
MQPRLYWQIHKLAFLLEKRADESLKSQLSIGFAQYKVLEAINQNMLAKQNVVAKLLDQTEASISRQIKILQKKGLITVAEVMGNKRAKELSLTVVGDEIVSQAEELLDITQAQIIGGLSYQEQRLFQELFQRMLDKARSDTK